MTAHARIIVIGLVQGVGYRCFALRNATALSLAGYAMNLPTGEVEIDAQGEKGMIEEFVRALRLGPRAAIVKNVTLDWLPIDPELQGFKVG